MADSKLMSSAHFGQVEVKPGEAPVLALRPREAAYALGIGARKLWELTRDKKIPHFRLGTAILYPVDALKNWLETQTRGGNQA